MTGEEYCQLTHYALSLSPNTGSSQASTVQKEGSKMLPMDCMTGESTELIVAGAVEYRDNALIKLIVLSLLFADESENQIKIVVELK